MHIRFFVPVTLAAALVAAPAAAQSTGTAGTGAETQGSPATGPGATGSGTATTPPDSASGGTPVPGGAGASAGVTAGASVYDPQGGLVGTIEAVEAGQAVLSTGSVKVRVPVTSFATGTSGLVIGMTKQELEAAAGQAK